MHKTAKITVAVIICLAFNVVGMAQHAATDSLQKIPPPASNPLERFNWIRGEMERVNLGENENVDSSLCIQLLDIAQEQKSDSLLAISYNWIGSYFAFNKGDNVSALEYYFKGVPLAEKANDKRRLSSLYFDIATVYSTLHDYAATYDNTIKGGQNMPGKSSGMYDFMLVQYQRNLSVYYLKTNKPDSALYYARLVTENSNKIGFKNFIFSSFFLTAGSYAIAKDTAMAAASFKKALTIMPFVVNNSLRSLFYTTYIPFLMSTSRTAQAKIVSRQFLDLGNSNNNNTMRLQAAGYMRQVFDTLQQTDSAYYYSRMESKINAAIFSQGNINRIQALSFHEKLRNIEEETRQVAYRNQLKQYMLVAGLLLFISIGLFLYRNNIRRKNANKVLAKTLADLKATQSQLVQSEKMASLGELTAGIAHEIQNPLNFVNNFSEVNKELVEELKGERLKVEGVRDTALEDELIKDIEENSEKINHHGKRADAIVKGMLQHSRSSTGIKEPTDINALADEYLRLAYHGLRAKDKTFNATLKTDYDESIGKINIVPQDIGRVLLNLYNNAFYAVAERKKQLPANYEPTVRITTSSTSSPFPDKPGGRSVTLKVSDNGGGIPQNIVDKIFQPFFTTKPTGQGTGLGLSLAYDIVKAHGGELNVKTKELEGTTFTIQLPIS